MSRILVVDDSAVDRTLVGDLLAKDESLEITFAEDGEQALQAVASRHPDLIITDLIMPHLDGLQLVESLRQESPPIPIVLMTSQGSEDLAAEALRMGAASYVPKRALAGNLAETVERLLAQSERERAHARLVAGMTRIEASFRLENDVSVLPALVRYFHAAAARLGLSEGVDRIQIGVALEEALCNALYHGNLELASELRDRDFRGYYDLAERRAAEAPYRDRRIQVEMRVTPREIRFQVRDEGLGFDPVSVPDPMDPAYMERASGRGILLMKTFMDEVRFNDTGTEVVMVKRVGNGSGDGGEPAPAGGGSSGS